MFNKHEESIIPSSSDSGPASSERSSTTNATTQANTSNGADTTREMILNRRGGYQIKQYIINEKGDTTHETFTGSGIFFPKK